jgi:acetyl esterase/lipase
MAAAVSAGPASAADAEKLLSADTDLLLSLNVRQFLTDHQNGDALRRVLDLLTGFAKTKDLGFDLTRDVDRITCGFTKGDGGSLVVLVEGRFQKNRLRAAVERLAKDSFGPFKTVKAGERELWQIAGAGTDIILVLLDANTLAVTGGKKANVALEGVLARHAGRKKGGLSPGLRALLARNQKEHVVLLVNRVEALVDEIARQWPVQDDVGKWVMQQIKSEAQKHTKDIIAAGVTLSLGESGLNFRLDLETKDAETARRARSQIQAGNFWTSLALLALDRELNRQWADILRKERFELEGATLTVHVQVPYEFFELLGNTLAETTTRQVSSIPLWGLPGPLPPGACTVVELRDVAYRDGPKAVSYRNRLDLFYPKGTKGYPVVVLVHGGGWTLGDNRCCGLYSSVGQFLASQGIGVVMPNYRLSPAVQHPEHVKDVARAVAWTRAHIAEHGGDPERLFLMGHSAGGHLVSLLATDASYLKAEGIKPGDVKGVIAVSGVYEIPPGNVAITLGGAGPQACGLDQNFPLRGDGDAALNGFVPAFPAAVDVYGPAFGEDPKERANASPLKHVRPGLPPFLLLTAERDLPTLSGMAEVFHRALREQGCDARLCRVEKRNHNSLLFSIISPEDPAARAVLEFLCKKRVELPGKPRRVLAKSP